jgi:hypothetical protein
MILLIPEKWHEINARNAVKNMSRICGAVSDSVEAEGLVREAVKELDWSNYASLPEAEDFPAREINE